MSEGAALGVAVGGKDLPGTTATSAIVATATPTTRALVDPEPLIRSHAVWALGELIGQEALGLFEQHLKEEADTQVLAEIERLKTV